MDISVILVLLIIATIITIIAISGKRSNKTVAPPKNYLDYLTGLWVRKDDPEYLVMVMEVDNESILYTRFHSGGQFKVPLATFDANFERPSDN